MSVIFESRIKCNEDGKSFIELTDTVDGRVVICDDVDDYSKKIEELGSDYGGNIDEVKWFVDENVTQEQMDRITADMNRHREETSK